MANNFKEFMLTQYTTKQLIEELDKRIRIETIRVVRLSQGPATILIDKE